MAVRTCPRTLHPQLDQGSKRAQREGSEETGEESSRGVATPIQCTPITLFGARSEGHLSCLKPGRRCFHGVPFSLGGELTCRHNRSCRASHREGHGCGQERRLTVKTLYVLSEEGHLSRVGVGMTEESI